MNCVHVPQICMPKEGIDLKKWSVVACDQYTSQPEYWAETEQIVGAEPSTLRLTLPEVYLDGEDEKIRVENIHNSMKEYVEEGLLLELEPGFMLVERSFPSQSGEKYKPSSRYGIVLEVDLETYEYKPGANSLTRPTEMTVEERIPPRLRVRQNASIEIPHIMLLIDDPERTVIEPIVKQSGELNKIYDVDLMQRGGHIKGWHIPEGEMTAQIMGRIEALAAPETFKARYHLEKEYPLLHFAVGDGNHSMATAKAAWETIKKELTEQERKTHPARFCLCEVVNVHDESLEIEPIHRVLFGVNCENFLQEAKAYYESKGCRFLFESGVVKKPYANQDKHTFSIFDETGESYIQIQKPAWGIAVASLQSFLDYYIKKYTETKIDYIHGEDVVKTLGTKKGNMGFLLPELCKEDLFRGVIVDGVLPRKTFSMGEANEKRYYMECKKLR